MSLVVFLDFQAQQIGTWQVYPAYTEAIECQVTGSSVYALYSSGNLLKYDKDGDVTTYDCYRQLNGIKISNIAWSQSAKQLLIVYEDGNVDLMDSDDNVVNIPFFRDSNISSKVVNSIYVDGDIAYLCTSFGLVQIDMRKKVFLETLRLGYNVIAMTKLQEHYVICTNTGLYKLKLGENLHDQKAWEMLFASTSFTNVFSVGDKLAVCTPWSVLRFSLHGWEEQLFSGTLTFVSCSDNTLVFGTNTDVYIYQGNLANQSAKEFYIENTWNAVSSYSDYFWVANGLQGLCSYRLTEEGLQPILTGIKAEGPIRDDIYHMYYNNDRLFVAGGVNTQRAVYNKPTAMYMNPDGQWVGMNETSLVSKYPGWRVVNAVDIVQDPNDQNHHYVALYRTGLAEFRNTEFVKLYNYENSPLKVISGTEGSPYKYNYCTCDALAYDDDGVLWMANQQTDTIIRFIRGRKWGAFAYPELNQTSSNLFQYCFTQSGVNLLVGYNGDKQGLFAFRTNGNMSSTKGHDHRMLGTFNNQRGTTYSPKYVNCAVEDHDNQVWIGTTDGPFVILDPDKIFDEDFSMHQIIINREDGSGLADYLLSGVEITCIAIDPANRKWLGTNKNGLYLLSHDGQEMLEHFTTQDSPILSDNITSIAIEAKTGRVMIGTDKGLCSYLSQANEGEEKLDEDNVVCYPNPVNPATNSHVVIRGLVNDSEVKILTSSGKLVWRGNSIGGTCQWDCCDGKGRRVASGVYHVVANTSDGKTAVVTRLIVIQ